MTLRIIFAKWKSITWTMEIRQRNPKYLFIGKVRLGPFPREAMSFRKSIDPLVSQSSFPVLWELRLGCCLGGKSRCKSVLAPPRMELVE